MWTDKYGRKRHEDEEYDSPYMPNPNFSCTRGKPLLMVIPPEGITISCPVHPNGHFIKGPNRISC